MAYTVASSKMVLKMEKVSLLGAMAPFIRVTFEKMKGTEKGFSSPRREVLKDNGRMTKLRVLDT